MNAETIYDKFFNEQGLIKLRNNQVTITITAYRQEEVLQPLYLDLSSKLEDKGIDPRVSCLNNYILKHQFK